MQDDTSLIDKQTIFELAAPPSYKDFMQMLMVQRLCFHFNLLPASKSVRLLGNSMF